ncbi:ABC transporter permease [Burkholderia sp. BE17]|uniref:ABC transporter permease n=1 Tax=Burkholderia sp. BE17 TaxID=2656644 RepID=UPI00128DDAD5|nr:ABC transporter permease subunit [Burkholderia sp. BE17]MPV67346.1 ABC transporter permease subunit [Burkholderia sp. BE17]
MHIDIDFLGDTLSKLLAAVPSTLGLFFASLIAGGLLSIVIVAMRVSPFWLPNRIARLYILVFRGSPLLIQMFLIYYGLGQFDVIRASFIWPVLRAPYSCAIVSLALCTAGYTAEIIRGGLLSVPVGQIEAAQAIGMPRFTLLRRIIAPITLRHVLPAYSTEAVLLVKSTALASLVTVWEVTGVAQQIIQRTYRTMEVFICAAAIYLVLNFIIVRALAILEAKLSPHLRERRDQVKTKKASRTSGNTLSGPSEARRVES